MRFDMMVKNIKNYYYFAPKTTWERYGVYRFHEMDAGELRALLERRRPALR